MKKKKINNGIFYVVISFVAVLAISSVVVAYSGYGTPKVVVEGNYIEAQSASPVVDENLGAFPGTDIYQPITFHSGFGGKLYATSTNSTSETITEELLQEYTIFEITPLIASLTWTLPATSTLTTLLKNEGDTQTWIFRNATSSTGVNFTLAKGTGWDLTGVDANVDVIAGAASTSQVFMQATCTRTAKKNWAFDIVCFLEEYIAAD